MGKRRIRNLLALGVKPAQIVGVDPRADRRAEAKKLHDITCYATFKEALKHVTADVYVISTPPDAHSPYFLHALKHSKHFFVEHPTTDRGYGELLRKGKKGLVQVPSCSFRFHPAMRKMKELIDSGAIGKVQSFQYHMGQYLPDWHPWEDYRDVYFSKKSTGACREMFAFELGWLSFVLPIKVEEIMGITGKLTDLDMTADDHYAAVVKCKNRIRGTMVIDILSRKPFRTLRVMGSEGVLEWEWQDKTIKLYDAKTKKTKVVTVKWGPQLKNYINTEDMYEAEIAAFVGAIKGGKPFPFSFKENLAYLSTLFAIEKSAATGRSVRL